MQVSSSAPERPRLGRRAAVLLGAGVISAGALASSAAAVLPVGDHGRAGASGRWTPCPPDDGDGAEPVELGDPVTAGGLRIVVDSAGGRPGSTALDVLVEDGDGDPVGGALVYAAIRMPSMDHGVSAYPAGELEPGRYRAEDVSLGMAGEWTVTVHVVRQARAPADATYRVEVPPS